MPNPEKPLLDQLLDSAAEFLLFRCRNGQPYCSLPLPSGGRQVLPLRSEAFRACLAGSFYANRQIEPRAPVLRQAVETLEARTRYWHYPDVSFRLAGTPRDTIVLHLATRQGQTVEISTDGCTLTTESMFCFRDSRAIDALPIPEAPQPSDLDLLASLLNLPDRADFLRALAWLLAAFHPEIPYPILVLQGPPSSGKSTAARFLRALLDPSTTPLAPLPQSESRLHRLAYDNWILAFDHVTRVPVRLSDALCRLSTGTAFFLRETPSSETIPFHLRRPILLTVPTDPDSHTASWKPAPDLADRILTVTLPPIPPERRRSVADLERDFTAAGPRLLGLLCGAVAAAMRRLPNLHPDSAPRFADAALWVQAAAPSLQATEDSVREALSVNHFAAPVDPLPAQIVAFMEDRTEWTGAPADLLRQLPDPRPPNPSTLSQRLLQQTTRLAASGITVEFSRSNKQRSIKLEKVPPENPPSPRHPVTMDGAEPRSPDRDPALASVTQPNSP